MKKRGIFALVIIGFLLVSLSYFSIANNTGLLEVTTEHPFLVNGNWVSASSLAIGDLLTTSSGKKARITGIEEVESKTSVYNLETGENNYVAGDIVVHNSNSAGAERGVIDKTLSNEKHIFYNAVSAGTETDLEKMSRDIQILVRTDGKVRKEALESAKPFLEACSDEIARVQKSGISATADFEAKLSIAKDNHLEVLLLDFGNERILGMETSGPAIIMNSRISNYGDVLGTLYHEFSHSEFDIFLMIKNFGKNPKTYPGGVKSFLYRNRYKRIDMWYDEMTGDLFFKPDGQKLTDGGRQLIKVNMDYASATEIYSRIEEVNFANKLLDIVEGDFSMKLTVNDARKIKSTDFGRGRNVGYIYDRVACLLARKGYRVNSFKLGWVN